jgi:hypothetical protein
MAIPLSQQLRDIANSARQASEQQVATQQAGVAQQTQAGLNQIAPMGKTGAQQVAGAVTAAQAQPELVAQQQMGQTMQQVNQAQLATQGQQMAQRQQRQQMLDENQIAELQRSNRLRQSSRHIDSSKKLSALEIAMNNRLSRSNMDIDNTISFLTRKQREDLTDLDRINKHILFDQRLMFKKSEDRREFSNTRQLADWAIFEAKSDQDLIARHKQMEMAHTKHMMVLEHAHGLLTQRIEQEWAKSEQQRDHALLHELGRRKNALEKKKARKRSEGAVVGNLLKTAAIYTVATLAAPATGGTSYVAASAATPDAATPLMSTISP